MPLVESESLILKSYNLSEADKIIVFLTRDHGIVRGVAKGAKRLKSRFGSSLEPFSLVVATYFEKETVELVSIERVELLASNFAAATDPSFLGKFAYLTDLLMAFLPPHDPNETLFRMTQACIETAVAHPAALSAVGVYFELWLLKLAGFLPDWSTCRACGRELPYNEDVGVTGDQHLICGKCRRTAGNRTLTATARMMATSIRSKGPQEFARSCAMEIRELDELSDVLREIASRSLGRKVMGEMKFSDQR
ncbi:MAG: DNA repair protein RecO [Chloracidobacterium sp.]|nr:DNA repair protein RecO [Chloracidobacterium sp.]